MKTRIAIALTTMLLTVVFVLLLSSGGIPAGPTSVAVESRAIDADPALPRAGDLTLGGSAGRDLIGLTIRPGKPGPNTALIYVLPLEGPAAEVPVSLSVSGQAVALDTCSHTCRSGSVHLVGGEHLDVRTDSGTASFDLPELPTQDGIGLLQQVQDRMHQLHTYRVDETLGPAAPPLQAAYLFEAPDRMQLTPVNGETTLWVGPKRYTRPVNSNAWQVDDFGSGLPVPSFIWDIPESGGKYAAAHIVGSETVDGVLTLFLDLPQTPVWFRLWVDADGLVHRASMRAQGHFMEHTYSGFDTPLSIEAPI